MQYKTLHNYDLSYEVLKKQFSLLPLQSIPAPILSTSAGSSSQPTDSGPGVQDHDLDQLAIPGQHGYHGSRLDSLSSCGSYLVPSQYESTASSLDTSGKTIK